MIRVGDRIRVAHARGSLMAVVDEMLPSNALPETLPGMDPLHAAEARRLIATVASHVAILSYSFEGADVVFFVALRRHDGAWFDVAGNALTIEPVAAVQEALFDTSPRPN